MQRRGLQPDVITWNAAISACEKGAQWERALELFEEMQRRGLQPITWSAVQRSGNERWSCSRRCSRRVEPDFITWSTISACEKGAQWERALELFEEMQISCSDCL